MKGNLGQELLCHAAKRILTAHPCHLIQFLGLKKKKAVFLTLKKNPSWPSMVIHTCHPSTQKTETGGLQVRVQTWLPSETVS